MSIQSLADVQAPDFQNLVRVYKPSGGNTEADCLKTDVTAGSVAPANTYADLVEAMRRGKIRTAANDWPKMTREEIDDAAVQFYDLGGVFREGHPEDIGAEQFNDYQARVPSELPGCTSLGRFAVGFLWKVNGQTAQLVVCEPLSQLVMISKGLTSRIRACAFINGDWWLLTVDAEMTIAVACLLIDDAETNVEFIDRPEPTLDAVNRGRAQASLTPIPTTRVISLSKPRKVFLGDGPRPHQGGTHARPCEHIRVLTRKFIEPKNRRGWWREEKVVTVNEGVRPTRVTRVVA